MNNEIQRLMRSWNNINSGKGPIVELSEIENWLMINDTLCQRYGWTQEQLKKQKIPFVLDCIHCIIIENKKRN